MIQPYVLTNGLTGRCWGADVVPQLSLRAELHRTQIHAKGKVSAIVHKGRLFARHAYGIAMAGETLLLGHDGAVTAERADLRASAELWRAPVDGEARELAVADGRLFVGTDRGVIYCFETDQRSEVRSQRSEVRIRNGGSLLRTPSSHPPSDHGP
jgi:outer membrane protein assembly factor BamB